MTTEAPELTRPAPLDDAATAVAEAAGDVEGVHALGSLLGRASDAVRARVGLASTAPGVKVDQDRAGVVTASVSIVVEYPHKLREVADRVREAARRALAPLGSDRADITITVTGVFGPFDTDPVEEAEAVADDAAERAAGAAAAVGDAADDAARAVGDAAEDAKDAVAAGAAKARDAVETASQDAETAAATETQDRPEADDHRSSPSRERSADDAQDVVADALHDAAEDIARAADEVRGTDPHRVP